MRPFSISRLARRDLDETWLHIARGDGVDRAEGFLADIGKTIRLITELPGGGTDRSKLRPGMRSSPCHNHVVFYKKTRRGIEIVRVLHGARRFDKVFQQNRRRPNQP